MAPAKPDNENFHFLFTCFESAVSNGGKVDVKSVAAAHHISPAAASMRLSRLRKHLNSRVGQNEHEDGGAKDATDVITTMTPKASKSATATAPKGKGKKSTTASPEKRNGTADLDSTLVPKSKKRKLAEVVEEADQAEEAGVEVEGYVKAELGEEEEDEEEDEDEEEEEDYEE